MRARLVVEGAHRRSGRRVGIMVDPGFAGFPCIGEQSLFEKGPSWVTIEVHFTEEEVLE